MSDKTSSTTPHAAEITLIESENNGQFADPDFLTMRQVLHSLNAMRKGNFSVRLPTDWVGLEGKIADAFNEIIAANERMAKDLRHVSKVVGKQSRTGQRARFSDTGGAWQGMEDSINSLIGDLAWPTTEVTRTIGAVAKGNLTEAMSLERDGQPLQGEFLRSAKIVNTMIAQLGVFTSEVTRVAREVGTEGKLGGQAQVQDVSGVWKDLTANVNLLAANLTTQVRAIAEVATAVTKGDLTRSIQVDARGEVAELKDNLNAMISNLRGTTDQNTEQDWLKTNLAKFTRNMQGQRELATVGQMLLSELAVLVNAQHGVIYQMEGIAHDARLRLLAGYAMHGTQELGHEFRLGEGLVGQCAFEKRRILLNEVPDDYVRIGSALGHAIPQCVIVLPVLFEGQVKAVIELASLAQFTQTHLTFLTQLTESLGIVLNTLEATMRTEGLLQRSQKLTAELQTQQTELQSTNEALAQQAKQLAEQNAEVERKNVEIDQARRAVEEKAAELALTSKYKSEFLANMSHELRTPLNSILILGQQLGDNVDGNLTSKQVEFAKTIHAAGGDLLNLISDILDLSKIESGTVTVEPEDVSFLTLRDTVERGFRHVAETKNLAFRVDLDPQLPRNLVTDQKRLLQVLKNLLSNAFKFTQQGHVDLHINVARGGWSLEHKLLHAAPLVVSFSVSDTGIGIASDKQRLIFEAFQQADAGTSRRYGGTGLGLAISRELANLLGGEIRLSSAPGQGSTFTLYLPLTYLGSTGVKDTDAPSDAPHPVILPMARTEEVPDDRESIQPGDPCVLVVDDDPHYARVLLGQVRDKGFKGLVAHRGSNALSLARQYQPTAITLDIFLPDMLGWTVLSHLKRDPTTRHIPVQILTVEEERQHGLEWGAFSYLIKPMTTDELETAFDRMLHFAEPRMKQLLVVDDDDVECRSLIELLGHEDIQITTVGTGAEALAVLSERPFDCMVLDLRLPDLSGFEVLNRIQERSELRELPIVVFTGRELSPDEELQLKTMAKSIIVKGVQSPERLLDETALFLHRVTTNLPADKQKMLERLHETDEALTGKKALVVDDDVRNIFALNSLLERHSMHVVSAETGAEAIDLVTNDPDIDIVLMDIMMPEMDGYETMRTIRRNPAQHQLPIIALTAKAMKGDREKCLEAGASDYIAKPVNTEQLLSLMRVWLHR